MVGSISRECSSRFPKVIYILKSIGRFLLRQNNKTTYLKIKEKKKKKKKKRKKKKNIKLGQESQCCLQTDVICFD